MIPNEFVRYHLTTALVAVGCEHPLKLHEGRDALEDRLDDENPYVRGRAAEALGILMRVDDDISVRSDSIPLGEDDAATFVASRRALLETGSDNPSEETTTNEVGTLTSIREGTEAVIEAMRTPDSGECPHCGLSLPDGGPPMCPRCGAPY
jgi:HEAT repeat protein